MEEELDESSEKMKVFSDDFKAHYSRNCQEEIYMLAVSAAAATA